MKVLCKSIIVVLIMTVVTISCAPARTSVPTATLVLPTASPSPTHAATATPSPSPFPTLTPTETQIPEPWIDLLTENRQYAPEGLSLGTRTAEKLKFNPKADQEAIQEQILASQMRQLMIPENRYILDKLLEAHPEWEGTAWNSIANPFEFRLQVMNAVMELTGGRLFTKLWPSNTVALWDANQPVQFECDEVPKVPSVEGLNLKPSQELAYGALVDASGKLVYRYEMTPEGWHGIATSGNSKDFYCSFILYHTIEAQAKSLELWPSDLASVGYLVDFRKFALDLIDISGLRSDDEWQEGFLSLK